MSALLPEAVTNLFVFVATPTDISAPAMVALLIVGEVNILLLKVCAPSTVTIWIRLVPSSAKNRSSSVE